MDEVGELVVTEPMPSMPLYFWGDSDGSRYRESYFEMFPGVWRHGDWIEITDRGTAIISRPLRRDDQPRRRQDGHRARSTAPSSRVDEVVDALVARPPLAGTDGYMPLFVVLRDGVEPRRRHRRRTSARRVRDDCSPRHVPDSVEQIAEVPARSPARCSSCP